MRPVYIVILSMLLSIPGIETYAQTITLEDCKEKAVMNYPLIKQFDLINKAEKLELDNLAKNYLPKVNFQAQATYQSEVTKLPLDVSALPVALDIPTMSKDQYKASLEFSQLLWDGGLTTAQKEMSREQKKTNVEQLRVNLYTIAARVNQLYFNILNLKAQQEVLSFTLKTLYANQELVRKMCLNGVALPTDIDMIEVEVLNINQQMIQLKSGIEASTEMLALFTGIPIQDNTKFEIPPAYETVNSSIKRPELSFYEAQAELFNSKKQAINAMNKPFFNLFMQTGYGRPGLNMLEDKFKLFAIGGVRVTWNFGNLYTKSNDMKLIENSISSVNLQKEVFLFNTKLEISKEEKEIDKAKKLLQKDDEIIRLRKKIRETAESKYQNGVYQINELIRDINAESIALQTKAFHEMQHLSYIYNYKHIKGN